LVREGLQICGLEQRNATLQVGQILNIQHGVMITEGCGVQIQACVCRSCFAACSIRLDTGLRRYDGIMDSAS
jgi:hypothetical protein